MVKNYVSKVLVTALRSPLEAFTIPFAVAVDRGLQYKLTDKNNSYGFCIKNGRKPKPWKWPDKLRESRIGSALEKIYKPIEPNEEGLRNIRIFCENSKKRFTSNEEIKRCNELKDLTPVQMYEKDEKNLKYAVRAARFDRDKKSIKELKKVKKKYLRKRIKKTCPDESWHPEDTLASVDRVEFQADRLIRNYIKKGQFPNEMEIYGITKALTRAKKAGEAIGSRYIAERAEEVFEKLLSGKPEKMDYSDPDKPNLHWSDFQLREEVENYYKEIWGLMDYYFKTGRVLGPKISLILNYIDSARTAAIERGSWDNLKYVDAVIENVVTGAPQDPKEHSMCEFLTLQNSRPLDTNLYFHLFGEQEDFDVFNSQLPSDVQKFFKRHILVQVNHCATPEEFDSKKRDVFDSFLQLCPGKWNH